VSVVEVDLERERATVDYDPGLLTISRLEEAIQRSVILPQVRRAIARMARPRRGRRTR
jgi:hypothetical protein